MRSSPIDGELEPANERLATRATILLVAAITIPLVVALVSVSRETWYPTGDMAQAELHVAGFFRHPPLVGAAGRIGSILVPYGQGSHPGPALWFALLPTYLLTGRSSFGLELGMTLTQLAFIVATVVLVRRLFGALGGLVIASVAAAVVYALGPAPFIEPWNPWGALFAFFCFIALCLGVVCGRHRWLPGAAFAGYFAFQCHAGYALLVGVGLLGATGCVAWAYWRARRGRDGPATDVATVAPEAGVGASTDVVEPQPSTRAILMSWWITVAVTVLMWLPPVVDQIRRKPGNLRILWDHFTASTNDDGTPRAFVGIVAALKEFAGEFAIPGPWIRGAFRQPADPPNIVTFLIAVALVATSIVVLVRRRDAPQRDTLIRLFVVLGVLALVGIVSTSRIFGEFFDYVVRWWWIIVAWVVVACVLVLVRRVPSRWVVAVVVAFGVVMSGLATSHSVGEQNPGTRNSRLVGGIVPEIAGSLNHDDHYLIRWYDPATLGGVPFGVLLELEKRGDHVGVDAQSSAGALPHRVLPESSANAVLWVVLGDANIDRMRQRSDAVELGSFDQRSQAEIAASNALRQHLIDRLTELDLACLVPTIDVQYGMAAFLFGATPVPPDVVKVASDYNVLGQPVAVFKLPPNAPSFVAPGQTC